MTLRIALVAHDAKKAELCDFVAKHIRFFERCELVSTGTTGTRLLEACPQLRITRCKSGPLGGDQQIGSMIAEQRVDALIFLPDPLTPMPHDVDVKALLRLTWLYNVPTACNLSTAEALVTMLRIPTR